MGTQSTWDPSGVVSMAIPMKRMKSSKAMKVSRIARGRGAKSRVFSGKKAKTVGGLTKDKLCKNKNGKVVSKAASARGKRFWARSPLKAWSLAIKEARKALDLTGHEEDAGLGKHLGITTSRMQEPSPCTARGGL